MTIFSKKDFRRAKLIQMAEKALRVIAVAYKDLDHMPSKIDSDNIENELNIL